MAKQIRSLNCCKSTKVARMDLTMGGPEEQRKSEKPQNERSQEEDKKGQPLTGGIVGLLDTESNGDWTQHCPNKNQLKTMTAFMTKFLEVIHNEEYYGELDLVLACLPKPTEKSAETTNTADDEVDSKAGQDKKTNNEVKEEAEEKELDVEITTSVDGKTEVSLQLENKESQEAARSLARQMYNLTGFKRSEVAYFLSQNTDIGKMVAKEYLSCFDFTGMRLDMALRLFLGAFILEGATQTQEHILTHFSERYYQCNPTAVASMDVVHCLTCALMLLNSDLHGQHSSMKMSCKDFLRNLSRMDDGLVFPEKLSKQLYRSIKKKKLECGKDDDDETLIVCNADTSLPTHFCCSSAQHLANAYDCHTAVLKTGYLIRKKLTGKNGKKTRKGQRDWKPFNAILKGMVLFLQKGQYNPEDGLSEGFGKKAISLHNATAFHAMKYRKRPNVLCVKTADMRYFYFQAESEQEMMSWIKAINGTVACNSGLYPSAPNTTSCF